MKVEVTNSILYTYSDATQKKDRSKVTIISRAICAIFEAAKERIHKEPQELQLQRVKNF